MVATPRVSIIIVATSGSPHLPRCLESLIKVAPAVSHETIVVVNNADAAEEDRLRGAWPGVQVQVSEINLGFAAALNAGRALASGEFIVSLHDDAEVQSGWLEALVQTADGDPGAGAVGSLALGTDGQPQSAGWQLLADGRTRPPWDGVPPRPQTFQGARPVDYSPSCSLLVRASSWDAAGGADERLFPVYYIDVDLCLAIRARGQRIICDPASVVVHRRGSSTGAEFAQFVSARNRELLLQKWGSAIAGHAPGSAAPLDIAPDAIPPQERAGTADARRLLAAVRDAATWRAYAAAVATQLETRDAELAATAAELETARVELSAARDELEAARVRTHELRRRSDTLARVEAGGWWQLRSRILPLIRLAGRIRAPGRR